LDGRIVEVIEGDFDIFVGWETSEIEDSDGEGGGAIGSVWESEAGYTVLFTGVGSETVDIAGYGSTIRNAEVVEIQVIKNKLNEVSRGCGICDREINIQRVHYRSLSCQNIDAI